MHCCSNTCVVYRASVPRPFSLEMNRRQFFPNSRGRCASAKCMSTTVAFSMLSKRNDLRPGGATFTFRYRQVASIDELTAYLGQQCNITGNVVRTRRESILHCNGELNHLPMCIHNNVIHKRHSNRRDASIRIGSLCDLPRDRWHL
jgi:hypothetical protein